MIFNFLHHNICDSSEKLIQYIYDTLPKTQDGKRSIWLMTLLIGQFSTPKVIFKYIPDWCIIYIMVINNSFSIIKNKISIITVNKTKWQNHNCPIRKQWWNNWKFIKYFIKKIFYLHVYIYTYTEKLYNCITHTCTHTWQMIYFIFHNILNKNLSYCILFLFIYFCFFLQMKEIWPSTSSLGYMTQGL